MSATHEEPAAKFEVGMRKGKTIYVKATGQKGAEVEFELTAEQAVEMATLLIQGARMVDAT